MNKITTVGAAAALALSALALANPASAAGPTTVFTQGATPGAFTFSNFNGTDNLKLTVLGSYMGDAGLFSFTSSFTGSPAMDGTYTSTSALTTFSFKDAGDSTFTTIASGTGNLYFDSGDPGVAFSGLKGYSFVANTLNTSTSSLGFGTKETGQVYNGLLTMGNAPVPEASTVISFGALLALGSLAVLRRKSVQNAV